MSKGIYVGVPTEVPIYEETVTEFEKLSYATRDLYFSRTVYSYSIIWDTASAVHGGLRYSAQNKGINSSTGGAVFTALHDLKNVKVYCEYCTEKNWDKVTTIIAGETVMNEVSGTDNTALNLIWSGDLAAGEKIDCKYVKDSSTHASGEKVYWEITCDPLTEITQEIVGYETKELARKVKKPYVEVEGLARKVKKGYIGVEGVARQFFSDSSFGSFSGDYTVSQVELDGAAYDLYTLTSSGILTLTDDTRFWMCGGGGAGSSATSDDDECRATGGAGGGYLNEGDLASGTYAITIGNGGSYTGGGATIVYAEDGTTILHQANGGKQSPYGSGSGGDGGSGGAGANWYQSVNSQGNPGKGYGLSTYPFGIAELLAHCAGGGSGAMYNQGSGWPGRTGGSNGSDGTYTKADDVDVRAPGGDYGGGAGGTYMTGTMTGEDGSFYGAGGGGAAAYRSSSPSYRTGSWSKGYQGVCYLLIPA